MIFLTNSDIKQTNSFYFKPFKPLVHYSSILDRIEGLISLRDYEMAMKLSENLRSLALQGLHYFQTYDWLMLMSVITLGYIGWMISLLLHVLRSYTSLSRDILQGPAFHQGNNTRKVTPKSSRPLLSFTFNYSIEMKGNKKYKEVLGKYIRSDPKINFRSCQAIIMMN